MVNLDIKCPSCGAHVSYEPGTEHLSCQYCHHAIEIETADSVENAHDELDLHEYLSNFEGKASKVERKILNCSGCGANTELDERQQSGFCPFCDTPLVLEQAHTQSMIKPAGLLPFGIDEKTAKTNFKSWVSTLWFAPNELKKKAAKLDNFKGIYLPFWTYDCYTSTNYTGQRGDYYYVSVSYKDSEGKSRTRQERRTRWRSVSGHVSRNFDDVLIPATHSVPQKQLNELQPWDLRELVDYKDEYISGYLCESYDTGLKEGFQEAKVIINDAVCVEIRRDIGGDEQRISSVQTRYIKPTFKHVLLPVWASAYRFKDKVYQVLVNARTGEVQGERPWSWVKIGSLVLVVAATVGAGVYWHYLNNQMP